MKYFNLLTPFAYWMLILMWSYILYFYLRRILSRKLRIPVFFTPLLILAIDAFRPLVESIYFGAWYTSAAGLLPIAIHDFLVLPQNVFIPKAFNVLVAFLVIGILIKRYIPEEEQEMQRRHAYTRQLEAEVTRRTQELATAYDALSRANEQLKELDVLKSNFIDITSHELRTPMFCIRGMLSILRKESASQGAEMQSKIGVAIRSANRLDKLIVNTLKILEGEEYEKKLLVFVNTPLKQIVTRALRAVEPFSQLRNQQIIVPDLENAPRVEVDLNKMQDILINLLMNAIKFTPDGGKIFIEILQPDPASIEIHVRDEGVGIADSDQPHIFEKFFTGMDVMHHASGEYEFLRKGFGMGLAIVKKFVEMHGGTVGMTSTVGVGSDFFFRIPIERATDSQLDRSPLAA